MQAVSEIGVDGVEGVKVFEKLQFSMLSKEVRRALAQDHPERKDVLLLGIEVRHVEPSAAPLPFLHDLQQQLQL